MKKAPFIFILILFLGMNLSAQGQILKTTEASVFFMSDAPLELIEAKSEELQGAIDIDNRTFAFSILITSFQGFNNPLQREHFNENYMESQKFSNATFTGKIIEKINPHQEGKHVIRAKGKLKIHGIEQERIIKSELEIKNGKWILNSDFTILLEEHEIRIPKIVNQKISEEIKVSIKAIFENI